MRAVAAVGALLLTLLFVASRPAARQTGQDAPRNAQLTYRSGVMLVPVDVHVIDNRTGTPVTDLKQADFAVFEDDVRQEIRHFTLQAFGTGSEGDVAAARAIPGPEPRQLQQRVLPLSVVPQTNRVFLIVFGRGRLQATSAKVLEAAAHFVRSHLLPADLVSVFAYDRATDFTSDHEQVARVIDRFKADNDAIAAAVDEQSTGLAGLYGSRGLPVSVQARINAIFKGTATLPYSPVGSSEADRTPERTKRDMQRQIDNAMDAVIAAGRMTPQAVGRDAEVLDAAGGWTAFDSFVGRSLQTLEDTANLYGAIAYMRRIEGEKHLVFVTGRGLRLRTLEDYRDISALAADARVALDVVQGGFGDVLQATAMRTLSEDTGGVSSIADYGQVAFDRLDQTTRTGYLLGYYPANARKKGEYRQIRVTVNRPGVTAIYRRGYQASDEIPTFDRREYTTRFRLEAALARQDEIKDIPVKMKVSVGPVEGRYEAAIDAYVDPTRLGFEESDGARRARLDIAVVAVNERREVLAAKTQTMGVKIPNEAFARAQKEGITISLRVPVPAGTRYVRFVVYDYTVDLLGAVGSWVF